MRQSPNDKKKALSISTLRHKMHFDFEILIIRHISSDIWIGLYGNGINLVWQNTGKGMVYSNWDTSSPNTVNNEAVAMTQPNFQWTVRPMTDQLSHALCQGSYQFSIKIILENKDKEYEKNHTNIKIKQDMNFPKQILKHV